MGGWVGGWVGGLTVYLERHAAGLEGGWAHVHFEEEVLHVLLAVGLPSSVWGRWVGGRVGDRKVEEIEAVRMSFS